MLLRSSLETYWWWMGARPPRTVERWAERRVWRGSILAPLERQSDGNTAQDYDLALKTCH
jgi:hypothetical protein